MQYVHHQSFIILSIGYRQPEQTLSRGNLPNPVPPAGNSLGLIVKEKHRLTGRVAYCGNSGHHRLRANWASSQVDSKFRNGVIKYTPGNWVRTLFVISCAISRPTARASFAGTFASRFLTSSGTIIPGTSLCRNSA